MVLCVVTRTIFLIFLLQGGKIGKGPGSGGGAGAGAGGISDHASFYMEESDAVRTGHEDGVDLNMKMVLI